MPELVLFFLVHVHFNVAPVLSKNWPYKGKSAFFTTPRPHLHNLAQCIAKAVVPWQWRRCRKPHRRRREGRWAVGSSVVMVIGPPVARQGWAAEGCSRSSKWVPNQGECLIYNM